MKFLVAAWAALAAARAPVSDSDYFSRLTTAERELAAASGGEVTDFEEHRATLSRALQGLGDIRSQVGDHAGALEAYASMHALYLGAAAPQRGAPAEGHSEYVQSTLDRFTPEPAIDAIVRAARDRQIVILNEAHHVPRHRAFGLRLALALRKQGFTYLAMETLSRDVDSLERRGYPTVWDGYYSDEPLFGDFIRQALRAGYRPIAYEQEASSLPDSADMVDRIESREEEQANNLIERVLKRDPAAKLFVYVGYSHAWKGYQDMPGDRRTAWMAERLRAKSGIDPLCIDQTTVIEPQPGSRDRALLDAIFATRDDDAVVLADKAAPGSFSSPDSARIDVQVFHRPTKLLRGRPDWLAMGGYREPRAIPAKLLPKSGRRLVQAFVVGEPADAVPVDQIVVKAGTPMPVLMLPKGKYRFAVQD